MYVFIMFIYLQAIFAIKDQFWVDFEDFNWRYSQCSKNVNVMSGCRVNIFT